MSSFRIGEKLESRYVRNEDGLFLQGRAPALRKVLLENKARLVCRDLGLSYREMSPVQRLFLTHYRCPVCKLVPLYFLDLTHRKRARCSKCGNLVSFTSSGKYGKIRKRLAMFLQIKEGRYDVS
jgi:hypothetical protein